MTRRATAGAGRDFAEAQDFENLETGIMDRACGGDAAHNGCKP